MTSKYPGRENWYRSRYEWAKKHGKCPTHIARSAARGAIRCQECLNRLKAYLASYGPAHRKERRAYSKKYDAAITWSVHCILAARWKLDEPICQWGTLPITNPLYRAANQKSKMGLDPCDGAGHQLEIDHMDGGGRKEIRKFKGHLKMRILDGDRELDDLRLLCILHNQWNRLKE